MPPESLSWDRKESVLKNRKHERGPGYETLGGFSGGVGTSSSSSSYASPRWREPYHGSRDFSRASPRRHIQGHYRQAGGYHQQYGEEYRSNEKSWMEDEGFRPSMGRYNGSRGGGNGRESRKYVGRSPNWDSGYVHKSHNAMPQATAPRSFAVTVTPLPPQPKPPEKGPSDLSVSATDNGVGADDGHSTVTKRSGPQHSMGSISWKPLKWGRSLGFSSSKTIRSEADVEAADPMCPSEKDTPGRSPLTSPQEAEDGVMKKRPRLGWGQGLAKYEKQKVGGVEDLLVNNGLMPCNGTSGLDTEKGVKCSSLPGCHSPVILSFTSRIASPGAEENPSSKFDYLANDPCNGKELSGIGSANPSEELPMNLELKEAYLHLTLSKLISDLLLLETIVPNDSGFTSSMNKLLLMKDEISRELEKTEYDIDQFEIEMKTLESVVNNDCGLHCSIPPDGIYREPSISMVDGSSTLMEPVLERSLDVKDIDKSPLAPTSRSSKSKHVPLIISDGNNQTSASSNNVVVDETLWKNGHSVSSMDAVGNVNVQSVDHCDESTHKISSIDLVELILTENKNFARMAVQLCDVPQFEVWGSKFISSLRVNDTQVKKKLAIRRRRQKVKERLLILKYRSCLQLWKEDLRSVSTKKQHPKTNKRLELSVVRTSDETIQKQRLFTRPRYMLSAPLSAADVIAFANKIILDPQIKTSRCNLKMPALFLDEEKRYLKFRTTNGLIEDPMSFEKAKVNLNPWTQEEKEVFMAKLAMLGKNFTQIASFLEHKTTADCVEFYYKNHKCGSFSEVKKHLNQRKQWQDSPTNNYLVAAGKKRPHEVNVVALDAFGIASAVSVRNNYGSRSRHKFSIWPSYGVNNEHRQSHGRLSSTERKNTHAMSRHEKESAAEAVQVAGIYGAPSKAVSSCLTSSTKGEALSVKGFDEFDSTDWTDEEKSSFIDALSTYGKDFARISRCVGTRSRQQCQNFFSKARKCLGLDAIISQGLCNRATPQSDMDGACVAEMDSGICSTRSKNDGVYTPSAGKTGCEYACRPVCVSVQLGTDRSSADCESREPEPEEINTNLEELALSFRDDIRSKTVDAEDGIRKDGGSLLSPTSKPSVLTNDSSKCLKVELDTKVEQKDDVETKPDISEIKEMVSQRSVDVSSGDGFKGGEMNTIPTNIRSFSLGCCRTDENGTGSENKVNFRSIYSPRKQKYKMKLHDAMLTFIHKRPENTTSRMENLAKLPEPSSISSADHHPLSKFHDVLSRKSHPHHFLSESPLANNRSKAKIDSQTSASFFDASRFNGGGISPSVSEILFSSRNDEQGKVQLRPRPRSAGPTATEQRHGSGDIKLFGQILNPHVPSAESSKSSSGAGNTVNSSSSLSSSVPGITIFTSQTDQKSHVAPFPSDSSCPYLVNGGHLSTHEEILQEFRQQPFSFDSLAAAKVRAEAVSNHSVGSIGTSIGTGGGAGSCMGLSDPLAAMKMYPTLAEVVSNINENETWRTRD